MAFQLQNVVPWGRNFEEYQLMFELSDLDRNLKIAGFGDGPASFNFEATKKGWSVTSFDGVYQFGGEELRRRIEEVRSIVMAQMAANQNNYNWRHIRSLAELESVRMAAMAQFLHDYELGKAQKRYICHELPAKLPYADGSFDLGLSSHFLLLYPTLGYDFHIASITEMLRVCREVRIFPIVDLDGKPTELTGRVIRHFERTHAVAVKTVPYEFQKGGNQLLAIKKASPDFFYSMP